MWVCSPVIAMYGMYDGNNTFYVENDGSAYGDYINDIITIYYSYGISTSSPLTDEETGSLQVSPRGDTMRTAWTLVLGSYGNLTSPAVKPEGHDYTYFVYCVEGGNYTDGIVDWRSKSVYNSYGY